ncbi:MAG TPA: M24 family metallopeptidase [Gaiellaceae bacterium]|nr:M24 family metallopeptidase [Gaiellaceae bacterium]
MNEAERKRALALEAAGGRLVTSRPADVRWLLCGRGRPVETGGADYTVALDGAAARVLFADIEEPRVREEERLEELGYELAPFPWFEGHGLAQTEAVLERLRLELGAEELDRYRVAGAELGQAMVETVATLTSADTELAAAGRLSANARARGFTVPVLLVAGDERQGAHRHPLPTRATLGAHALLAITAEREGLHVSLTRIVSFGPPPGELRRLVEAAASVDVAMLTASRPGVTTGEVLEAAAREYEAQGFPEEWRRHHQGGITGYRGREVFAVPGEATPLPDGCAVAWNPSITGGGKSEDTALVTEARVEVITRTPELGELQNGRPAIVEL